MRNTKNIALRNIFGEMALTIIKYSEIQDWSVANVIGNLIRYNSRYPLVRLGELLSPFEQRIVLDNDTVYQQVSVKGHGDGITPRVNGKKKGRDIKTSEQYLLKAGNLVFSKIDARNGAFAIVPKELDGAIVTKDFPAYNVDECSVRPQYLALLLASSPFMEIAARCSKGTTNRRRVDVDLLLNQKIGVPSFQEQDEILCHYNHIIGDIQASQNAAQNKEKERNAYFCDALGIRSEEEARKDCVESKLVLAKYQDIHNWNVNSLLRRLDYKSTKYVARSLSELQDAILMMKRGSSPQYGSVRSTTKILNQRCVRWGYVDKTFAKGVVSSWAEGKNKDLKTHEGDVLINSTGEGTIGRSAVVDANSVGLLYDSHVMLLRVDKDAIDPTYLSLIINSHYGQSQIEQLKSAKTTKQTELGVANMRDFVVPMPPIKEQRMLSVTISAMNKKIAQLSDVAHIKEEAKQYFEHKIFQR